MLELDNADETRRIYVFIFDRQIGHCDVLGRGQRLEINVLFYFVNVLVCFLNVWFCLFLVCFGLLSLV